MDIYFYCSYEHSHLGFFPSRMGENGLVPADRGKGVTLPDAVTEFFSYDRFRILWRDFPEEKSRFLFPEPSFGMLGLRGLEGSIGSRKGIINLAVIADRSELEQLKKMALAVIGNYYGFSTQLFRWMSLGGKCGYDLDVKAFGRWQEEICGQEETALFPEGDGRGGKLLRRLAKSGGRGRTERDLLHFAVCTDDWKFIAPHMGNQGIWGIKPKDVFTWEQFTEQFLHGL